MMRMRQLQTGATPIGQRSHMMVNPNPSINPPNHMPTAHYHVNMPRTPQPQQPGKPHSPEQFIRGIAQWMQQRGFPFNPNPLMLGRPIPLVQLFSSVMRFGGSTKIIELAQWTEIAKQFHVPQPQLLAAAHDLLRYWHDNHLSPYEAWFRQRTIHDQMRNPQNFQGGDVPITHRRFSPVRQSDSHLSDQQRQQYLHAQSQLHGEYQTTPKRSTPQPRSSLQPKQNGHLTPQQDPVQVSQTAVYSVPQPGSNLTPNVRTHPPSSRSASAVKEEFQSAAITNSRHPIEAHRPPKAPEGTVGEVFTPKIEPLGKLEGLPPTHGGIAARDFKEVIDGLLEYKPDVPVYEEIGIIDIEALTMSLRSGMHAEVRLALDTLATLTSSNPREVISSPRDIISLEECEDLVETLMECAEDQVELLAENAAEVSDAMLISSYEEIVRGCRVEIKSLQDVHEFGTLEYNLDRCVERLICITTILRNLSFSSINHKLLADPIVVRFMATVIRYLGTRNMLLRTYRNTLDFTKDVVVFLSNLAQAIEIPGKEEALSILHFLLSFAPFPPPTVHGDEDISFAPYNPTTHCYLPSAVESLAKLLARDDPNRTFYRDIFTAEATAVPPYDLLTRTFGLAVASMPEHIKSNGLALVDVRQAFLAQGVLAAEILAGLIPISEHALARSWLSSQDGFALNLVKIVSLLATTLSQGHLRTTEIDFFGYNMIISRGLALLRKLAEKSKDTEGNANELPLGILPRKEGLVGSLMRRELDLSVVRQLCNYWGLEN